MSQETNPFRLSMRRSESPIDGLYSSDRGQPPVTYGENHSGASATANNALHNLNSGSPAIQLSQFRPNLINNSETHRANLSAPQPPPNRSGREREPNVKEPPSYLESEGRRSNPNLAFPTDEKAQPESRDDRYRQGYEEGVRMALQREKERRHELRKARQLRESSSPEEIEGERFSDRSGERPVERHGTRRSETKRERPKPSSRTHSFNREASPSRNSGRRGRSKSESAANKAGKPSASLDVIDKLDATGIYGGSRFHHDGPFDACTPRRNQAKGRGATPISAFPPDGPNNSLKVENPQISAARKADTVYGQNVGGPSEFPNSFDPAEPSLKVYGERTMALGSSTFIDGTVASRDAIQCDDGLKRTSSLGRSFLKRVGSSAGQGRRYSNSDAHAHHRGGILEEREPRMGRMDSVRAGKH